MSKFVILHATVCFVIFRLPSSSFVIVRLLSSSFVIFRHLSSSFVFFRLLSSSFVFFRLLSSSFIFFHLLSSSFVIFRLLSSSFVFFVFFRLLSSSSSSFVFFRLLSSSFVSFRPKLLEKLNTVDGGKIIYDTFSQPTFTKEKGSWQYINYSQQKILENTFFSDKRTKCNKITLLEGDEIIYTDSTDSTLQHTFNTLFLKCGCKLGY